MVEAVADAHALVAGYRPRPGVYDECIDEHGRVRAHWAAFVRRFAALTPESRDDQARALERRLRASGVAFNVYARPDDRKAAWDLDLWPVILADHDWRTLEAAVAQRVRVAEATLGDVYGRQRLLREGALPPALVFGNEEYLAPCAQWPHPPLHFVSTYAVDVARGADGRWIVLADQADVANGHGWVLASRVALAQTLGPLFLEEGVHRLAGYAGHLNDALRAAAGDRGRVVMVSAGPDDAGYFSHAFLARYLGVPLVGAADLAQRDGRLFTKSLEGLRPVGAVLRKRLGRELDPLHLPGFAGPGTPGLLDAARLGHVALVNAVGSGFLQNRTLAPFMPALARYWLDAAPLLEDAPCVWLGDTGGRRRVAASPLWQVNPLTARHDPGATAAERDADVPTGARLEREGHRWIAQRPVPLATTPCWHAGRLEPVPWAMRLFACVVDDRVHVLPGGLGRLAPKPSVTALPAGRGSKDVWVHMPAATPPHAGLLSQRMTPVRLQREPRDVLSGTAEALFWLGRYTERAESHLRTLRAVLRRLVEAGAAAETAASMLHLLAPPPDSAAPVERLARAIEDLLGETGGGVGLPSALTAIQRNLTLARNTLSRDSWDVLNALVTDGRWRRRFGPVLVEPPVELVDDAIRALVAFSGTVAEHMTRNDAWRFLDIGKRLERALQMADLVDKGLRPMVAAEGEAPLAAILEIADSDMTYRGRYMALPSAVPVLDLLLLDESNPRGLLHQVVRIEREMLDLPREGIYRTPAQRAVLALSTRLRLADADALDPSRDDATAFARLLGEVRGHLHAASDHLHRAYFVLAEQATTTFAHRGPGR